MYNKSKIGKLNFCNAIDELIMDEYATLGSLIYITGYPTSLSDSFSHIENRKCQIHIGRHSAITSRHFIDCTAGIKIGTYTTIAGIRTQILTHSIDLEKNRQDAKAIEIGDYCFIGTNCVILPGAKLPNYSILGASSLLNKALNEEYCLYGGVPIKKIAQLKEDVAYFSRITGRVK